MSKTTIINGNVFTTDKKFIKANIEITDSIISDINRSNSAIEGKRIDASDCYCIPGLIDTHLHGADGSDFSDGTVDAIERIAKYELTNGITSFCPATMTLAEEDLLLACDAANDYIKESNNLSELIGIHMEGPFFNKERKGAQPEEYLRLPDTKMLDTFMNRTDLIKIWSLAPELDGGLQFIDYAHKKYPKLSIALGHTCADANIFNQAFECGASRLTHLYNGMKHYESAKNVAAAHIDSCSQGKVLYAELICDGIHNDIHRIISAFDVLSSDHIILISDSMRATGLGDGKYSLGGQDVYVSGRLAALADGSKAGSVSNLYDMMKCVVSMGIRLEDAISACTINPAKSLNIYNRVGSLDKEKQADILILDRKLNLKAVIKKGKYLPV